MKEKQRESEGKKTDWKQKKNGQSRAIKLKKNTRTGSCFRWVRIWLNDKT